MNISTFDDSNDAAIIRFHDHESLFSAAEFIMILSVPISLKRTTTGFVIQFDNRRDLRRFVPSDPNMD
jgi:hypothetical protein